MSEVAAPPVAPVAVPAAEPRAPVAAKAPEPEPSEEYEIDGKKVSLTRTQARTAIQKAAAADKRFKEAADARAKQEDWEKLFDEDPEAALRQRGKDPEKAFEEHLAKRAKQALMTPEQLEAAALKEKLARLEAETAKTSAEKKKAADAELDAKNSEIMQSKLIAAADKYSLEATPEVLEGLCDVAIDLMEYGTEPSPDQIAQEYQRRELEGIEKRDAKKMSQLSGKALLTYLGPANIAKLKTALAAADAESLKGIPAPVAKVRPAAAKVQTRDSKGAYIRENDFDKKFGL